MSHKCILLLSVRGQYFTTPSAQLENKPKRIFEVGANKKSHNQFTERTDCKCNKHKVSGSHDRLEPILRMPDPPLLAKIYHHTDHICSLPQITSI